MKRILLYAGTLALMGNLMAGYGTQCPISRGRPYAKKAQSTQASQNYHNAIMAANQAIEDFVQKQGTQELKAIAQYVEYYKSWYQSVTPAPRELVAQLSQQALALVEEFKTIAQTHFMRKRDKMGASALTKKGEKFFTHVIKELNRLK